MSCRDEGAFVLAEALVVAVIVAILAAVAIPTYTNYVNGQRKETARNLAQTAAISANSYWRRTGSVPAANGSNLNLFFPDAAKYTILVTATHVHIIETADNSVRDSARYIPQ